MATEMTEIRKAIEQSDMTYKECARLLGVAPRTLQDWAYGTRRPRQNDVLEKIQALSILTEEGRKDLIENDGDWKTVFMQYKIEQARKLSHIGSFGDSFSYALKRVPDSCMNVLPPEALAELIDAFSDAYQDGRMHGRTEREE